jgi:hypothetical protein
MDRLNLVCTGSPFQRGLTHGLALKDAVGFNLANFWAACAHTGLSKLDFIRAAKHTAQDYVDSSLEEIRAIARGASVDAGELLAFNLLHGVVFSDECTVLFAMGDSTASGNTLFLKNSDKIGGESMVGPNFYEHKEINVVLVVRPDDGPAFIGVSSAGSTGLKMGANDAGIAAGTNIARTVELGKRSVDTTQMRALDRVQLARDGLVKLTALDAATYIAGRLAASPTATPGNIEFVDAGMGTIIESSYDRVALQLVRSGIASRANSFVVLREMNDPADASSYCRYVRTQQLLKENSGKLTPALMIQFSRDHEHGPGPNSICRHGKHYIEETSQSAMVVELSAGKPKEARFWIALGKPCHAWQHPDGSIQGSLERLTDIPEGFLNGEVWRRFWTEEPRLDTTAAAQ